MIILLTRPLTLSTVRFISEDRLLGGLFHELGVEKGGKYLRCDNYCSF